VDDAESCLHKLLGVLLCPLSDGAGEPEGCGVNGGIEHRIEGEDCFSQCRGDWQVVLLGDVGDKAEWDGGSCWRW